MDGIDDVAKKTLADRVSELPGKADRESRLAKNKRSQLSGPPTNDLNDFDYERQRWLTPEESMARKKETLKKIRGFDEDVVAPHGSALKNADSTAPAYKKVKKPAVKDAAESSLSMTRGVTDSNPFAKLENDLPRGGRAMRVAAEEGLEQEGKQVAKKGLGKLGRMATAGLAGGAVGLGVNALMEGLDAEETGSEEEDMDVASQRQFEKSSAKIKANKPALKAAVEDADEPDGEAGVQGRKLPSTLKASTKKNYQNVKPGKVMAGPKVKPDSDIEKEFHVELARNYGEPADEANPFDKVVGRVMKDEFGKAAKRVNKR